MTAIITNEGRLHILEALAGCEYLRAICFTAPTSLALGDSRSDVTEATFSGYSRQTPTWTDPSLSGLDGVLTASTLTFTHNGGGTANTLRGTALVYDDDVEEVLIAEELLASPTLLDENGESVTWTPSLRILDNTGSAEPLLVTDGRVKILELLVETGFLYAILIQAPTSVSDITGYSNITEANFSGYERVAIQWEQPELDSTLVVLTGETARFAHNGKAAANTVVGAGILFDDGTTQRLIAVDIFSTSERVEDASKALEIIPVLALVPQGTADGTVSS